MAAAQYETRTRTVEETVVVLTLTEDEAEELRTIVGHADGTRTTVRIYQALEKIEAPKPAPAADTFEYDGVTYDLNAKYKDRDGDVWSFTGRLSDDGIPRVTYTGYADNIDTIAEIADNYGPLTKVTP
ncbi:phiSA1p31-related protein [Streptomyces sp. NPDC058375]|uniref:phiSA1p31-related protein n=1 Tax=Streptomyces sp. NPDC058375 TaxID=3346467 RepID=UPI003669E0C9